jgi:hypothetical protein
MIPYVSVNSAPSSRKGAGGLNRKKMTAAIHQEITREINELLSRAFAERRKLRDYRETYSK